MGRGGARRRGFIRRLGRPKVDMDARGGAVLAWFVERDIGGRSLRLACPAKVKVERRRRRCGGRSGGGGRFATARTRIETILRVDRAAERRGLLPLRSGAVGDALQPERGLLEGLCLLPSPV